MRKVAFKSRLSTCVIWFKYWKGPSVAGGVSAEVQLKIQAVTIPFVPPPLKLDYYNLKQNSWNLVPSRNSLWEYGGGSSAERLLTPTPGFYSWRRWEQLRTNKGGGWVTCSNRCRCSWWNWSYLFKGFVLEQSCNEEPWEMYLPGLTARLGVCANSKQRIWAVWGPGLFTPLWMLKTWDLQLQLLFLVGKNDLKWLSVILKIWKILLIYLKYRGVEKLCF